MAASKVIIARHGKLLRKILLWRSSTAGELILWLLYSGRRRIIRIFKNIDVLISSLIESGRTFILQQPLNLGAIRHHASSGLRRARFASLLRSERRRIDGVPGEHEGVLGVLVGRDLGVPARLLVLDGDRSALGTAVAWGSLVIPIFAQVIIVVRPWSN